MKKILSIGYNRKMDKKVAVFNLIRSICPIKSEFCKQYCYARKAERNYRIKWFRYYNYLLSKKPSFVDRISAELAKSKVQKVRIHESGDFYDQRYFNKWLKIIKRFPQITFLAFTKNYKLKIPKLPSNFKLYFSNDPTFTLPQRLFSNHRQAYVIFDYQKRVPNTKLCLPINKKHRNYCGSKCKNCWGGDKDVCFIKH